MIIMIIIMIIIIMCNREYGGWVRDLHRKYEEAAKAKSAKPSEVSVASTEQCWGKYSLSLSLSLR